jgi:hypothetical protein
LIAAGLHPKAIQAQMGHKSITMTLDRYGHLMPGRGDAVASALDAYRVASLAPVDNVRALPNGTEDRASTPPIVSADAAPATATG